MSRHVQNTDSSIIERRLRPIYDWLDTGNNKKALQECEKVLKKTPFSQCAKALKALTLLRMGKELDCNNLLTFLTNEKPTDEGTLQAMTLCYREMHEVQKICSLYETAVKMDPTNEELHSQLFMCYVKTGDFKLQQQTAMALYKQKPKNPYYCWIVMSHVLQATRGEGAKDEGKKQVLLSLAERMMKKLIDDNKLDAEQEVQLYILVLKLLKKNEEILVLLDGPLGEKLQTANLPQLKLEYALKVQNWYQVNILCKFVLNESFDRWEIWKHYINSVLHLGENNSHCNEKNSENNTIENHTNNVVHGIDWEIADDTPEKCHEFICGIIEGGADNRFLLRGPYLARFELCLKLRERNIRTDDILGDTLELFVEYFRKFGHKPCCVADLKIYLKLLNSDQKTELGCKLIKEVGIGPTSVPQSATQMQRHIGALQLSRLCGAHRNLSVEHLHALVTALVLHYQHGYQTYGKDLQSTDFGPSDNYALLAAHILFDLSKTDNGLQYLVAAIALLEGLIKNSPSNFHAKLLVLKFYHMLGDAMGANGIFYTLDIKHLQLDSLGYIHCAQLPTTGLFSICGIHYDIALKFFCTNYKESIEHLTLSYKFGSFFKLDEFMDFRERMNNSLHYTTVVVDRIMLCLTDCNNLDNLLNLNISPEESRVNWDLLRDNRDLTAYVTWDPEFADKSLEECDEIKMILRHDVDFLKLRTHILWVVNEAIEIYKAQDGNDTRVKRIENLKILLKDWKDLEDRIKEEKPQPISDYLIPYPPPTRLHGYLKTPYRSCITLFLEFYLILSNDGKIEELKLKCDEAKKEIETITENLQGLISTKSSDYREKRKGTELFVNNLEVINVLCVICIICAGLIKTPQTKKSKKKQNHGPESKTKEVLNILINELISEINKISELLFNWTNNVTQKDLVNILDSLNLNNDSIGLQEGFLQSYGMSYKEIQGVLKNKLKMLSAF